MPDLLFTSGIDGRNEPDSEEADLPDAPAELAGDLKNQKRMLEWITIIWFFMPGTKGQIISKWFFGVFDFLQKTNKNKSI